ncbi:MAG: single-stranded DNA-binding protein [Firmicutes bacterium]|nr:single-stranded DNA-binding protein [Bacillota bacterium]
MLNHITLMGRLTRDPEMRYTQNNTPVTSFTLAVDRDFRGRDGAERQTDFIDIVTWQKTAEFVSKNFTKGMMAIVMGRLQIRDWQDKEGNKRRSAEVIADSVTFGETRKSREGGGDYSSSYSPSPRPAPSQSSSAYDSAPSRPASQPSAFSELDDDGELPF